MSAGSLSEPRRGGGRRRCGGGRRGAGRPGALVGAPGALVGALPRGPCARRAAAVPGGPRYWASRLAERRAGALRAPAGGAGVGAAGSARRRRPVGGGGVEECSHGRDGVRPPSADRGLYSTFAPSAPVSAGAPALQPLFTGRSAPWLGCRSLPHRERAFVRDCSNRVNGTGSRSDW